MCLIMKCYPETAVWIYRYKSIVNGNDEEEEVAVNLLKPNDIYIYVVPHR